MIGASGTSSSSSSRGAPAARVYSSSRGDSNITSISSVTPVGENHREVVASYLPVHAVRGRALLPVSGLADDRPNPYADGANSKASIKATTYPQVPVDIVRKLR
jgi:hypothetical protein